MTLVGRTQGLIHAFCATLRVVSSTIVISLRKVISRCSENASDQAKAFIR